MMIASNRNRPVVLVSLVCLLTVAMAGCGLVETAVEPDPKRTLVIAAPGLPETIDPHLRSGGGLNNEVAHNVSAFLIDRKIYEEDGQLIASGHEAMPQLAESFEWNEDGSVWTFNIRPGLVFANGDPITKEDWEWNIDRWWGAGGVTWVMLQISGVTEREQIEVIDDTTIRMHVDPPNPLNEAVFASNSAGIVNPREVRPHSSEDDPWATEWLRTNVPGAGPFVLKSWTSDEIVLEKNENYFEAPEKPWFDEVIYRIVPDASSRAALLRAGDIDIAYALPLEVMPELEGDENLTIHNVPSTEVAFLGMNVKMAPFDNVLVRRAINYAVPYDTIIDEVLHGYGQRMYNYVPVGTPGYDPSVPHYDTDYEKARELLADAGYPDGFSAELAIRAGVYEEEQVAIWVRDSLSNVGIDVTIRKMPGGAFLEQTRLRQIPFFFKMGWTTTTNDPFNHLNWLVKAECCNYADYDNQEVWDIIEDYVLEPDEEVRQEAITRVQTILHEDAPWVPLYQPNWLMVTRSDIEGLVADVFFQNRLWYLSRTDG